MNSVQLIGRFTRDPEVRYTDGGTSVARFTLACVRKYKKEDAAADFISCVAFGKTAESIEKYFKKGNRVGLNGRIQTGNYTNSAGNKVYTTDVIVEGIEFVESKAENSSDEKPDPEKAAGEGFMNIPDGIDEELPFS